MRACRVTGSPEPPSSAWAEPRHTTTSEPVSTTSRTSVPSLYWRVAITATPVLPDPAVALGDLEALRGVVKFPVRIKCATLSWNTLAQALDDAEAEAGAGAS